MDKKCARLGNRATKAEREEAHRVKMEMKTFLADDFEEDRPFVFANLSQHHPEYGEQPREQTARMREKSS